MSPKPKALPRLIVHLIGYSYIRKVQFIINVQQRDNVSQE